MKTKILLLSCFLAAAGAVHAQSTPPAKYQIEVLNPAKRYLFVDRSWQPTADCIEAKVSVVATVPSKDLVAKAYFFGADGKLLDTVTEPTAEGDHNGGTVKTPPQYEHGKRYSFAFGVPGAINSGNGKWKRVVVVFGKGGDYAIKIYPKDDLAKFDFPEKPKTPSASAQVK